MEIRFRKTLSQTTNKRENTISTRKNNNVDTVIQPAVSQLIVARN